MQNGDSWMIIDYLGSRLSVEIDCPVKWPGFDKNMFVCKCDKVFPIYRLRGSDDWNWVKEEHNV
ncbi:hypothetical protein LCGC14_0369880 [marine sediment metagenome]|uniref:Uncharacterized protein n=1 Tax=marine sediment metagenome TaxID=412755 RepID=A0A0F9TBC9_9ZZZZ